MKHHFKFLTKFMEDKLGEPKWWEETGHPRWVEFAPTLTYHIYAQEVVLLEIACQNCAEKFLVTMNFSDMHRMDKIPSLADRVRSGAIHYGDPPNTDHCLAGPTMSCMNIRVVEFWEQSQESYEFERVPELEILLPDGLEAGDDAD